MKRWLFTWGLLLVVPAAGLAQTPKIQADVGKELHQARVYQDIEIMRRIVLRRVTAFMKSCSSCHAPRPGDRATALGDLSASAGLTAADYPAGAVDRAALHFDGGRIGASTLSGSFDGEIVIDGHYVKGQGVVLQAQLPAWLATMTREAPGHAAKKPPQPVNEWDVIRRQLWGEKVESAAPPEDPHLVTIQDVLLHVLAENGKHFQSLGANEQLTLAVTFRNRSVRTTAVEALFFLGVMGSSGANLAAGGGSGTAPAGSQTGGATGDEVKGHELLADLHLKQGRYQEAVKALQAALEINKDAGRAGVLYRKLASAYLLQDAGQGNQQILEKALEFVKKAQESSRGAMPTQRLTLPTRLVITASRTALQQASPGNLDEFRRQISVTWLRFDRTALQSTVDPEKTGTGAK